MNAGTKLENSPRWLFRVASRPGVGGGHVKRSLQLALALSSFGQSCTFYLDPAAPKHNEHWISTLDSHGIDWIEENSNIDCDMAIAHSQKNDIIILDSYDLCPSRFSQFFPTLNILSFDDFRNKNHGNFLIRQTLIKSQQKDDVYPNIIDGPENIILPITPPSQRLHQIKQPHTRRILISMGFVDSANNTGKILALCTNIRLKNPITVALGPNAPHIQTIQEQLKKFTKSRLIVNPTSMVDLYQDHDVALGAGGVSMLERIAYGLPSIVVQAADNQSLTIQEAVKLGLIETQNIHNTHELAAQLCSFLKNDSLLENLTISGQKIIDGRGAQRIAHQLLNSLGIHTLPL